jgi:hypothetical protein
MNGISQNTIYFLTMTIHNRKCFIMLNKYYIPFYFWKIGLWTLTHR